MPIIIKKPSGGKLEKGRDHMLRYTMTWDDGTHPNLDSDVDVIYLVFKESDRMSDDEMAIFINSNDNADQFITVDAGGGQGKIWIKNDDQDEIIPDTVKYCVSALVVLTDGTQWPFVSDYNVVFSQPVIQEIDINV